MNTRPAIDDSAGPTSLSVAFNQDSSCFSVGLDTGFCSKTIPSSTLPLVNILVKSLQFRSMPTQGLSRYAPTLKDANTRPISHDGVHKVVQISMLELFLQKC